MIFLFLFVSPANDELSRQRPTYQQRRDLFLWQRVHTRHLADKDAFSVGRSKVEKTLVDQVVVNHHLGFTQQPGTFERDQLGVARPAPTKATRP